MPELSHNGKRRVYRVLVRVAGADGSVAPSERAILERVVAAYGISSAEAQSIEAEPHDTEIRIGKSEVEHRALARGMVQVAAADGVLDPGEAHLLHRLAEAVGLPRASLDAAIANALERTIDSEPAAHDTEPAGQPQGSEIGLYLSGDLPPTASREALLDAAVASLLQTQRWAEVVKTHRRPPGREALEIEVEAMEHPIFGGGHTVTLRLLDASGTELESHTGGVIGAGDGLAGTVDGLACQFATPDTYPRLMQERGVVGDTRHPDVKALDPRRAHALALAACLNNQPLGLIHAAEGWLPVAAHTREVEHLLAASELFAMAGELKRAEDTLRSARGYPVEPLEQRLSGLHCFKALGTNGTLKLLLWLGAAPCRGERPELIAKVLRFLCDGCGEPLRSHPLDPDTLSSPPTLVGALRPVFGPLAAHFAFMSAMICFLLRGHAQLSGSEVRQELLGLRPYVEPLLGPERFARLDADLASSEGRRTLEELLSLGSSYVVHHVR